MARDRLGRRLMARTRRALTDRRGATALIFAGSAVALLGFGALAVEGGHWYLVQRNARSAADTGAVAGASARYRNGLIMPAAQAQAKAREAATDAVRDNGFAHGTSLYGASATTVQVFVPPQTSPAYANDPNAVEVVVTPRVQQYFASLFTGQRDLPVRAHAVATTLMAGPLCMLSKTRRLQFTGNTAVQAEGCVLASNSRDTPSVDVKGMGAQITAAVLYAVGTCEGCTQSNVHATAMSTQPPLPDPFESTVRNAPIPTSCVGNDTTPTGSSPFTVPPSADGRYHWCKNFSLTNNQTLTLRPGTYYIVNRDFTVNGGTVTCQGCTPGGPGVTLVLAGNNPGEIRLNGGEIRLNAPSTGDFPDLLIYDSGSQDLGKPSPQPRITVNGNAMNQSSYLVGGIYAPNSHIDFSGTAAMRNAGTACAPVVGGMVTLTGDSGHAIDCPRYGVPTVDVRTVRLVQ
jgi:Flp pilus assembly protein TadG